jgi:hypothetical protein
VEGWRAQGAAGLPRVSSRRAHGRAAVMMSEQAKKLAEQAAKLRAEVGACGWVGVGVDVLMWMYLGGSRSQACAGLVWGCMRVCVFGLYGHCVHARSYHAS